MFNPYFYYTLLLLIIEKKAKRSPLSSFGGSAALKLEDPPLAATFSRVIHFVEINLKLINDTINCQFKVYATFHFLALGGHVWKRTY
jgi:hypothetical protein